MCLEIKLSHSQGVQDVTFLRHLSSTRHYATGYSLAKEEWPWRPPSAAAARCRCLLFLKRVFSFNHCHHLFTEVFGRTPGVMSLSPPLPFLREEVD